MKQLQEHTRTILGDLKVSPEEFSAISPIIRQIINAMVVAYHNEDTREGTLFFDMGLRHLADDELGSPRTEQEIMPLAILRDVQSSCEQLLRNPYRRAATISPN